MNRSVRTDGSNKDPLASKSGDSRLCYILTPENVADRLLVPGWPHTLDQPKVQGFGL